MAARVARLLCDARVASLMERLLGINGWEAAVRPVIENDAGHFAEAGTLELSHTAGTCQLTLDLAAHPALSALAWPSPDHAVRATHGERALRTALTNALLEPMLNAMRMVGLDRLHIASVIRAAPLPQCPDYGEVATISFNFKDGRHVVDVKLSLSLLSYLEGLKSSYLRTGAGSCAQARAGGDAKVGYLFKNMLMPGRLVLGSRRLTIRTLMALQPGDVLLRSLSHGVLVLCSGEAGEPDDGVTLFANWGNPGLAGVRVPVRPEGHTLLTLGKPAVSHESDYEDDDGLPASEQPETPIELDELELLVRIEVDTVALTLSELSSLCPGYVLQLPTPVASAQLKLVTHGQTIGLAELVTVGEHLGVRILRMAHSYATDQ